MLENFSINAVYDILLIECDNESVINLVLSFLSLPDKLSTRVNNEHCINL